MSKKISIIVPCYLVEKYIDRCVNSLLNQTIGIDNLELIFINDASPDNTLAKLLSFEQRYPDSIIVINSEVNMKQGGARNLGLQYASADYIGFIDSDDWIEPTMYEKLYTKAVSYNCDVVACELKRVFNETTPMGSTGNQDCLFIIEDEKSRKELLISRLGSGSVCTRLFKKSLIFDNNIFFPEGLAYEDNHFIYFIQIYAKSFYSLPEYLYHYFVNPNSTIVTPEAPHHFDRLTIETMKLDELKRRGLFDLYYHEIEFNFLLLYYFNTLHIILTRFSKVPIDIVNRMRLQVKTSFPNYKNNPYIDNFLIELYKVLMRTIDTPLDQVAWDELSVKYKST